MEMRDSTWVEANYGTFRVIVFDSWNDGAKEVWTVSMTANDMAAELSKMARGEKDVLAQDLLADYNSQHYDLGTEEYTQLAQAARRGDFESAEDFVTESMR